MKTSSAKAKGRRCAQAARDILLDYECSLFVDDIRVTPSGVTGPDLLLSPAAHKKFPFAVECKNQESLNIWAALEQSEEHQEKEDQIPIVFFTRNHSQLYTALRLDALMILRNIWLTQGYDEGKEEKSSGTL